MSASPRAELLADGGAAASGREFFRSPEFFEAEGVTHTLSIEAADIGLVAPVCVREIPGAGGLDAISPYGYPGVVQVGGGSGGSVEPGAVDWSATGLVSLFLRHRLGSEPPLSGTSARNVAQIADPSQQRKSRASDRQQIRRNERAGYEVDVVAGPEADARQRCGFLTAYEQTMSRTGAAERYLYGAGYFDTLLASPATRLALVRASDGNVAAGSLVAQSDRMLHYYLSGTSDRYLGDSPMKTLLTRLVDLAEHETLPLNLGGGISPGDRLEEFKRGFANREETWRTSEIVCDERAYAELSARAPEAEGFFPAYRAPRY